MCQLLGMNCNTPTDIGFSFKGFRHRGGRTDIHADGFGIAFFEEEGVRLYQDNRPSYASPIGDMVENYPIKSTNIISHIRKASEGCVSIANTHPFVRELWGEYWVFAHNGHIDIEAADIIKEWEEPFYSPVGDTDSETLFCDLLNALRSTFSAPPSSKILFNAVTQWAKRVRAAGICNFLLSNGKWQIAHANTLLYYLIRQAPFGEATLIDEDFTIDFTTVTTPDDRVAVIATLPLTRNEIWQPFAVNEAIMFAQGDVLHRDQPEGAQYLTREEGLAIAAKMGVVGDY